MSWADKMSDRFPVVGELFRHSEIADRLPGAAVSTGEAFTILTEGMKRKGREQEAGEGRREREETYKGTFPCCCLYAVCNSGSYTITTPSCFRYMCFAIFLSPPLTGISFHGGSIFRACILTRELFHLTG